MNVAARSSYSDDDVSRLAVGCRAYDCTVVNEVLQRSATAGHRPWIRAMHRTLLLLLLRVAVMESAAEANHLSSTASSHYTVPVHPILDGALGPLCARYVPRTPGLTDDPGRPRWSFFAMYRSHWRPGSPGNNVGQPEGRPAIARSGQWQVLHQSSNMADILAAGGCLYLAVASTDVTVTVSDLRNRVDLTSSGEGRPEERVD